VGNALAHSTMAIWSLLASIDRMTHFRTLNAGMKGAT